MQGRSRLGERSAVTDSMARGDEARSDKRISWRSREMLLACRAVCNLAERGRTCNLMRRTVARTTWYVVAIRTPTGCHPPRAHYYFRREIESEVRLMAARRPSTIPGPAGKYFQPSNKVKYYKDIDLIVDIR